MCTLDGGSSDDDWCLTVDDNLDLGGNNRGIRDDGWRLTVDDDLHDDGGLAGDGWGLAGGGWGSASEVESLDDGGYAFWCS